MSTKAAPTSNAKQMNSRVITRCAFRMSSSAIVTMTAATVLTRSTASTYVPFFNWLESTRWLIVEFVIWKWHSWVLPFIQNETHLFRFTGIVRVNHSHRWKFDETYKAQMLSSWCIKNYLTLTSYEFKLSWLRLAL